MSRREMQLVRYSEAFKLQVVTELESGRVSGIPEAMAKFGITGATTVKRWLLKYGKNHLIARVIRVEKPEEKRQLEELRKENKQLKKALADSHLEAVLYRSWFKVACQEFGVEDEEAFKKKLEKRLSQ